MFTFATLDTYKISHGKKSEKFSVDYKVLVRLYEPIIGSVAMSLYLTLESEFSLNKYSKTTNQIARLHKLARIDDSSFNEAIELLKKYDLVSYKANQRKANDYLFVVYPTKPANEFFNNEKLNNALQVMVDDTYYNQVYSLLKWFETDIQTVTQEELYNDVNDELYSTFVTVLSVFSIGHFNFEFSEKELIDFNNIDVKAKYLEWNLKLKKVCNDKINSLSFTFNKNKEYNICFILNDKNNIDTNDLTEFMNITKANEYLFVSPNNFGIRDTLYLTIYDIDSFRRIQQIIYYMKHFM